MPNRPNSINMSQIVLIVEVRGVESGQTILDEFLGRGMAPEPTSEKLERREKRDRGLRDCDPVFFTSELIVVDGL